MEESYRQAARVYRDVWEWDVIILHGAVKVMGWDLGHLDDCARMMFGANCQCGRNAKISSDVVDKEGQVLVEGHFQGTETGAARVFLDVDDGSEIPVKSGKIYRLRGPRKVEGHDSYAPLSIWHIYAEPEPEPVGFWASLRSRLPWSKSA